MSKILLSLGLALFALLGASGARLVAARAGWSGDGRQVSLQQTAQYQWGDQAAGNTQQAQAQAQVQSQQQIQAQGQFQVREQAQSGSSTGPQLGDCDQQQDQDRLQTRAQDRERQQDHLHQATETRINRGMP